VNPFSLKAVFWREFGIFLLATSMMTLMTVPMAATMAQKGNPAWWLLVLVFPAISAGAGYGAYHEAKKERKS
jgi:hypothetical protein